MREGRGNCGDGAGDGDDVGLRRRGRPRPSSSSSPPPPSSARRGEWGEEGEEEKQRRRKNKKRGIAKAIRDKLPLSSASSSSCSPSCWGNVAIAHGIERRRSRGGDGEAGEGGGTPAAAVGCGCCVCPPRCPLVPSRSSNTGKEDDGLRSLLEHNDFYSKECNPHKDVAAS